MYNRTDNSFILEGKKDKMYSNNKQEVEKKCTLQEPEIRNKLPYQQWCNYLLKVIQAYGELVP